VGLSAPGCPDRVVARKWGRCHFGRQLLCARSDCWRQNQSLNLGRLSSLVSASDLTKLTTPFTWVHSGSRSKVLYGRSGVAGPSSGSHVKERAGGAPARQRRRGQLPGLCARPLVACGSRPSQLHPQSDFGDA